MAHSDAEAGEALIALAVNKFDFKKTADETHIPIRTLRDWATNRPKKGVFELLERALERALMRVDEVPAKDLPVLMGILLDKWLLAQGEPTSRTESLFRGIENLSDADRNRVIAEAERILAEADRGSAHPGGGEAINA